MFFSLILFLQLNYIRLQSPSERRSKLDDSHSISSNSLNFLSPNRLSNQDLSDLLWASIEMKTQPSEILSDVDVYVFLGEGVYLFHKISKSLIPVVEGDYRMLQSSSVKAPVHLLFVTDSSSILHKYRTTKISKRIFTNVHDFCVKSGFVFIRMENEKDLKISELLHFSKNVFVISNFAIGYSKFDVNHRNRFEKFDEDDFGNFSVSSSEASSEPTSIPSSESSSYSSSSPLPTVTTPIPTVTTPLPISSPLTTSSLVPTSESSSYSSSSPLPTVTTPIPTSESSSYSSSESPSGFNWNVTELFSNSLVFSSPSPSPYPTYKIVLFLVIPSVVLIAAVIFLLCVYYRKKMCFSKSDGGEPLIKSSYNQ